MKKIYSEFQTSDETNLIIVDVGANRGQSISLFNITQNGLVIELPKTIDLNQDARRYALKSFFQLLLDEEYLNHIQTQKHRFPRIEDAMFTQKISDQLNDVS